VFIQAIVEMKQRNPRFGCPRIAQQINKAFGTIIDKDVVRRVLDAHYRPASGENGPSWLSFLGHTKDSLWSIDQFRCESILLKSHWVLAVMDQFTRRIVGFGIHAGDVDGAALCRMFNTAISSIGSPKYLSSDNDPLFQYHQWQANLKILVLICIQIRSSQGNYFHVALIHLSRPEIQGGQQVRGYSGSTIFHANQQFILLIRH
jgi:putative transposase